MEPRPREGDDENPLVWITSNAVLISTVNPWIVCTQNALSKIEGTI